MSATLTAPRTRPAGGKVTASKPKKGIAIQAGDQSVLIDMLGETLPVWMQMRELLWNSKEAVERTGIAGRVLIRPTADHKVEIIDTGDGMTRQIMPEVLNRTLTSGNTATGQVKSGSLDSNRGLGSKITVRYWNPNGATYLSLRDGVVTGMRMCQTDGKYVVDMNVPGVGPDGCYTANLNDIDPIIVEAGHGTHVILEGGRGDGGRPDRNLKAALAAMQARVWERPNTLKEFSILTSLNGHKPVEIQGRADRMLEAAADYGYIDLDGATAHWSTYADGTDFGLAGGIILEDEVFRPVDGAQAKLWLSKCGVFEGMHRVAVYIQLDPTRFNANAERSNVHAVDSHKSVDMWIAEWQDAFKAQLPQQIIDVMAEETSRNADAAATIDRRVVNKAMSFFGSVVRKSRKGTPAKRRSEAGSKSADVEAPTESRDAIPHVVWRAVSELGAEFFGNEAGVYDTEAHTITLDSDDGGYRNLAAKMIERCGGEGRADIATAVDAIVRQRLAMVAVDVYFAGRSICAADPNKRIDRVFKNGVTAGLMGRIMLVPVIESDLRARKLLTGR